LRLSCRPIFAGGWLDLNPSCDATGGLRRNAALLMRAGVTLARSVSVESCRFVNYGTDSVSKLDHGEAVHIAARSGFKRSSSARLANVEGRFTSSTAVAVSVVGLKGLRLRPSAEAEARGFVRLRFGAAAERRVPVGAGLVFLLRARQRTEVSLVAGDGQFEPISWRGAVIAGLRRRLTRLRRAVLRFDGVEIFPDGPKRQTKPYGKHVRRLRRAGAAPDSAIARAHPELIAGWPYAPVRRAAPAVTPRVAVALHLHYVELWREIETLLGRWSLPFALFVTLTTDNPALAEQVRTAFPGAEVRVVENRGRDVRPFLLLLEEGALDRFDVVCKIHSKKSLGAGRLPIFGDIARRAMFLDLIASGAQAQKVAAMFADDPQLGVVGSARFRQTTGRGAPLDLGRNQVAAAAIAAAMGAPLGSDDFDYFDGTMLWARPQALAPLARLGLSREFPPVDAGLTDGALEHAVERLFNHAARAAGYRVDAVTGGGA
jgi:hypothetical protein